MPNTVVMRGSGLPLREPEAVCEACGAHGTVGRAIRTDATGAAVETHRFCASCWPENAARFRARWDEESRVATDAWMRAPQTAPQPAAMGAAFESATWHNALDLVRLVNLWLRRSPPPSASDLAQLAAEIVASAPEREGPMPFEIEMFIQMHSNADRER